MSPLRFAAASDTGRVHEHNEDRWSADPGAGLYIVSDGVGGATHGELAAQIVVDVLPRYLDQARQSQDGASSPERLLDTAVARLSDELNARTTSTPGLSGSGATVVAALIAGENCAIAHLGDSRAYLLRNGQLACLTTDHTIAQILFDSGELTIEELADHPGRNTLTRYVGMTPPGRPDVTHHGLQAGDRLLLCTDGVSGAIDNDTLQTLVRQPESAKALCDAIIDAANKAGGHDNMTALLIDAADLANTVDLQGLS